MLRLNELQQLMFWHPLFCAPSGKWLAADVASPPVIVCLWRVVSSIVHAIACICRYFVAAGFLSVQTLDSLAPWHFVRSQAFASLRFISLPSLLCTLAFPPLSSSFQQRPPCLPSRKPWPITSASPPGRTAPRRCLTPRHVLASNAGRTSRATRRAE